ncbi:hypothetical protein CY34DRAFT_16850 [Suillus luteus UH-Slu-Lm8-n1]|uniref:Uncharacterized protein n=1 Tax=Suillus luteus UH-Slu-Lm8-n1 TaxID=930992 RepID=A0A0D0AN84_9AGAM|nr:hypothetical protein CY34DRAFT_16850 [Suillus luteus UH-Slu-Lm8-n1]
MHHHRLSKRHAQMVSLSSPPASSVDLAEDEERVEIITSFSVECASWKILCAHTMERFDHKNLYARVLRQCNGDLLKFKPPQQYTASPTLPSRTPFPKISISKSLSGPYSNRLSSTTSARRYVPVYSRSPSAVLLTQVQDTNCEANMGTTQNKVL